MRHFIRPTLAATLVALAPAFAQAAEPPDCKNHYILDGPCVAVGPMIVTHTSPTGPVPSYAAIDATTGRLFVANRGTGRLGGTDPSVTVLQGDGTSVTLPMDTTPTHLAVSEALRRVVVASGGFTRLGATIIDSDRLSHGFHDLGYVPRTTAFDVARGLAYVAGPNPSTYLIPPPFTGYRDELFYGALSVIDLKTSAVRTIHVSRDPAAMVHDASRNRLYLAMHGVPNHVMRPLRAWLQAYDTASQSLVGEPRALPGRLIKHLSASGDGTKLFIIGHIDGSEPKPEGPYHALQHAVLWVVDAATLEVTATHPLPQLPYSPTRNPIFSGQAEFDATTNRLYVIDYTENRLYSVDVATGAVKHVATESTPVGLGINPASRTLVVIFDLLGQAGTYSMDLERLDSIPLGTPRTLTTAESRPFNLPVVAAPGAGLTYVLHPQDRTVVRFTLPVAEGTKSIVNLTDLWWDPSEPGFGLYLDQQGVRAFAAMFMPDGQWVVMPDSRRSADGSFSGLLYRTTGRAGAAPLSQTVGAMKYTAHGDSGGRLEYQLLGDTPKTRDIVRYAASTARSCSWASTVTKAADAQTNYTMLWSSPADQGWGLSLSQRGDAMMGILYDYDAQGNPVWSMLASAERAGDGSFTGTVYRSGATGLREVGTMSMNFDTAGTGALQTSIDGTAKSRPIARHVYAAPLSDCN